MTPNSSFDVVVIGGGPHGITYASWLKKWRPETRIAIVERLATPGYKVGESLLSTATRSFVSMGLSMGVMRRLFSNKAGIRFWWTEPYTNALHRHLDVVDIEETFQVERRVLDLALQETARRKGITLLTGTRVNLKKSDLRSETKQIACDGPDGPFTLSCRMVCDASGPASVLSRHLGLYRKAPEAHQTFTSHSYFAYFKLKKSVPVPFWEEPATRHLCFPGGWGWVIRMTSWDQTPDENLRQMVNHLLDQGEAPDAALPSRHALAAQFGATHEPLVSIGFTVRADRDTATGRDVRAAFEHYVQKHPAIAEIMQHYELVETPYGKPTSYMAFRNLVHDSKRVAGQGWCIVGDAAAFVNPLFSPGMNLGSGSCYLAAQATVDALDQDIPTAKPFADYEQYMRDIYEAVLAETDLYYRAFDHIDTYEWALLLKIFFGAADVITRDDVYTASDPYVHDLLNPAFRERVDAARTMLYEAELTGTPVSKVAPFVRSIIEPFVKERLREPAVQALRLGDVFSEYTALGDRVAHKHRHRPELSFDACDTCAEHKDASLPLCPICGAETAATHRTAA